MAAEKNNPRVFAETITLDAWRSPFDGERGEADLHIDVVFAEGGRVGGEGSPVRFRLSLRRAEVHIVRDSEDVIRIKSSSVMRAALPDPVKSRTTILKKKAAALGAGAEASTSRAKALLSGSASAGISITEKTEKARAIRAMEVTHWKTNTGYSFKITSVKGLKGQPWDATIPVVKLNDTNAKRKRGEPPEIRIEIHCLREDLVIDKIEFTDSSYPVWKKLPHLKQIAVEQYIRDELARAGLPCGSLSDPFTRIVLADAMPSAQL